MSGSPRRCVICGASFCPRSNNAKTCSKLCRHEKLLIYNQSRLGKDAARMRAYRAANPDKYIQQRKKWLAANPEKQQKERAHHRHIQAEQAAVMRAWRRMFGKPKIEWPAYQRAWYAKNKSRILQKAQLNRDENRGAFNAARRRRAQERRAIWRTFRNLNLIQQETNL